MVPAHGELCAGAGREAGAEVSAASQVPASLGRWTLTWHARKRIADRGFDLGEVHAACDSPDQTYTSYQYGPDVWTYQRGRVAVAVNPVTRTIITVLLRRDAHWTDGDARTANAA